MYVFEQRCLAGSAVRCACEGNRNATPASDQRVELRELPALDRVKVAIPLYGVICELALGGAVLGVSAAVQQVRRRSRSAHFPP